MRLRSFRYVPRRPSRHPIKLACQVVRERDFKLVSNEILELSECGLLIRAMRPVLTGEELLISFMAPFSRTFIDAEGTVARVLHGRRLGDTGSSLGISFDGMGELHRAVLRAQLLDLPTAFPKRRMLS